MTWRWIENTVDPDGMVFEGWTDGNLSYDVPQGVIVAAERRALSGLGAAQERRDRVYDEWRAMFPDDSYSAFTYAYEGGMRERGPWVRAVELESNRATRAEACLARAVTLLERWTTGTARGEAIDLADETDELLDTLRRPLNSLSNNPGHVGPSVVQGDVPTSGEG